MFVGWHHLGARIEMFMPFGNDLSMKKKIGQIFAEAIFMLHNRNIECNMSSMSNDDYSQVHSKKS